MAEFIASPPPVRPKIPVVTVRDLLESMIQFLPTIIPYEHSSERIEPEREDKATSIIMYGQIVGQTEDEVEYQQKVIVTFENRVATSWNTKLWSEPFEVRISIPYEKIWVSAIITPCEDRSIAIRTIGS